MAYWQWNEKIGTLCKNYLLIAIIKKLMDFPNSTLWVRNWKNLPKFKSLWSDVFLNQGGPLSEVWGLEKKFGGGGLPEGCFFCTAVKTLQEWVEPILLVRRIKKSLGVLLYKISFPRYLPPKLKISENRGTLTTPCPFIYELGQKVLFL